MTREFADIVEAVQALVDGLEQLRIDEPSKYYATPYQTLHERLKSALETYERERGKLRWNGQAWEWTRGEISRSR